MVAVSEGFGLASRVMSLVTVVERIGDQAGITPEQKVVSVGTPEGQDPAGVFPVSVNYASILGQTAPVAGGFASRGIRRSVTRSRPSAAMYSMSADASLGFGSFETTRGGSMMKGGGSRSLSFGGDLNREHEAIPVAAVSAFASSVDDFDLSFTFSGNLLVDVAGLAADGGVIGDTIEERVLNTTILMLVVAAAAKEMPGVYEQHLDRMANFLAANKEAVNGQSVAVRKAILAARKPERLKGKQADYEALFASDDPWPTIRASI